MGYLKLIAPVQEVMEGIPMGWSVYCVATFMIRPAAVPNRVAEAAKVFQKEVFS